MPSVEKKIRQAGWSKRPYKEAREEIGRFVEKDGVVKHRAKKPGPCKKTRGEHVLVYVAPNGRPDHNNPDKIQYWANAYSQEEYDLRKADGRGWWMKPQKVFRCTACGKMKTYELKSKRAKDLENGVKATRVALDDETLGSTPSSPARHGPSVTGA